MLNFRIFPVFRAKARPSKKARVNNPPEDQEAHEPEQTVEPELAMEPEGPHLEATFDEPPPQDHNLDEKPEVDIAAPDAELAYPNRADDRSSSPVRATETPSTPKKATRDKEGEVIITGIGHTSPGHPVILAKHSAEEERAGMEKGKWSTELSRYAHLSAQELHSGF